MGVNLVSRAFAYAVDVPLKPTEFRLLIGMCLTAMDAGNPPRYFDSLEASALALGRRVPDRAPGDDEGERMRLAAFQAVKIALHGLTQVGAVRRTVTGGHGRRAEYEIVLDAHASLSTAEGRKRKRQVGNSYPEK